MFITKGNSFNQGVKWLVKVLGKSISVDNTTFSNGVSTFIFPNHKSSNRLSVREIPAKYKSSCDPKSPLRNN